MKRKRENTLPTRINDNGYETVRLRNSEGKYVTRRVDELVAEAFVPNPMGKKFIRHKNGNKLDSRANNLEWVDEAV